MQWNACKSSEIKNPFGCRDVFIIKTLTSWILKKCSMLLREPRFIGRSSVFYWIISWRWRTKQNKKRTNFQAHKPFLQTRAGAESHTGMKSHMKSHRNEMLTVNSVWGWNESSTALLSETCSCENCACARRVSLCHPFRYCYHTLLFLAQDTWKLSFFFQAEGGCSLIRTLAPGFVSWLGWVQMNPDLEGNFRRSLHGL